MAINNSAAPGIHQGAKAHGMIWLGVNAALFSAAVGLEIVIKSTANF